MRIISIIVALVCSTAFALPSSENPISGRPYTLTYDPSVTRVLLNAKNLSVVYAFDYWGTRTVQRLRGEGPQEDLFQNVLEPEKGRSSKVTLLRVGNVWKTEIQIPAEATLLSYYVTDGNRNDDNDRKTYVSLVCDQQGNPVRGARFRNIDFLIMAGKGIPDILENLQQETKQYPDNLIAHLVYWRFRFFDTVSPDTLRILASQCESYFARLRKQFGDTVLNFEVFSLNNINRVVDLSLSDQRKERVVIDLLVDVNTRIVNTIKDIPLVTRSQSIPSYEVQANQRILNAPLFAELERKTQEQIRQREGSTGELVGQTAPDFSFETIEGKTHRLSEFRGKVVLLDFWGSWCGPCLAEIPLLVQVGKEFQKRGLVMISVSNDASAGKWTRQNLGDFTKKKGMNWAQVLDDSSDTIHKLYKIQFWPNPFLLDRNGKILKREGLRSEGLRRSLDAVFTK